ncbi:MAG: protein-tyrosine-phosphatase [Planctomycetes bacterium]|nr:protein-tyrosine-phosphatase [Planctomycetota bacterium]
MEFDQIPIERRQLLEKLSQYINDCRSDGESIRLNFICTHNSRRSHMAQLWAAVSGVHYGISELSTYSGGTEGTAFNPRAVAALRRAGFEIQGDSKTENPHYTVKMGDGLDNMISFSKRYDDAPNPARGYGAVLVCSQADKSCPSVPGAKVRIAIPFEDPKISDGTPQEAETYDQRCAQIAREILFAFSRVKR